ncbi:MAG: sugar phosphate isomerase/epimerase [Cyclobacteriaceae bacterium]|nr:sugar phosphate isomerase/epimerase [Cyclobacteriaceae bacterium]
MKNRREFIKTGAMFAAGSMLMPMGCSTKTKETVAEEAATAIVEESTLSVLAEPGVQVYSVRDALKVDFAGSIKKLADMGYKYVEAYGLGLDGKMLGMSPAEYKKIVDDTGMKVVSTHATYFTKENANQIADASLEAGVEFVVTPYLSDELRGDYSAVAENFNTVGEILKSQGLKFGYHNHAFEFEKQGDLVPLEILLKETQSDLVTFEADLYWVKKGGVDPMELINKFPGRFSMFHVKDADKELEQTTVGSGIIDFPTIMKARDTAGLKYYFIEDERTDDPFANLKANIDYMKATDFS